MSYLSPMRVWSYLLIVSFLALIALPGTGQEVPSGQLENPYQAVFHHLYWLQQDSYRPDRAAQALWPGGDSTANVRRAIQLKQILDGKGLFVRLDRLPRDSSYRDSLSGAHRFTLYPLELPQVYVTLQDGRWRYSPETWQAIPKLHRQVYPWGTDRLVNLFGAFAHRKFLGLETWQWGGLLGLPLILFGLFWLIYALLFPLMRGVFRRFGFYKPEEMRVLKHFDRYICLWLLSRVAILGVPVLLLPPWFNEWLLHGIRIAGWALVLLMGLRFIDLVFSYFMRVAERTESRTDNQILPILRKLTQLLLWILVLIPVLNLLEVNLTALIAGLSIGGLALALAAQDTVKNLISTLLIIVDHPYKLGDYIKAAGVEGTVVEIGFRSTRMMTTDSSIITIPNSNMINDQIVNLGARTFRLIHFMIAVVYGTSPERLEAFIAGLRELALSHPDAIRENVFVYLSDLNSSSIDIRFRVPVLVNDLRSDYQVREELVFGIIRLARSLGIGFAFPSQSLYVEQLPGAPSPEGSPEPDPDQWPERNRALVEKLTAAWTVSRQDKAV